MSWYHLEPQPRAYQGQSWLHVQEDTQTIPAGATRLFAGALIDVRPHTHDDNTIRPAFSRQTVAELATKRLDLAQQRHGADRVPAAVLQRVAADSAVGLGDYLGDLLPHLVPVDGGAQQIPHAAAGLLAHAVTVAARHLCAMGCRELAAALGSPQTLALLEEQIPQQLQPILDATEQAETARHAVDGNGQITCFTCDRKHPAATSRHLRYGWDCAACAGPRENWGGIQ